MIRLQTDIDDDDDDDKIDLDCYDFAHDSGHGTQSMISLSTHCSL